MIQFKRKIIEKIIISIFLIVGLTFGIKFYSYNNHVEKGLEEVEIRNFKGIEHLKLTGTVYDVQKVENKWLGYGGREIIRINIVKSNMTNYDPRETQANYFCIIKNEKAEIYAWGWDKLKNGDTLKLDIEKRMLRFIVEGEEDMIINDIWISYVDFFNFIKKQGYQKL